MSNYDQMFEKMTMDVMEMKKPYLTILIEVAELRMKRLMEDDDGHHEEDRGTTGDLPVDG